MNHNWRVTFGLALALFIAFYFIQLLALMIRFEDFPNYVNFYSWLDNSIMIIESTPSWRDTMMILKDEWWLEVGYFNTDFGLGISEWSLYLAPVKLLIVFCFCLLISFNIRMSKCNRSGRGVNSSYGTRFTGGMGAACLATTSLTMSWVVCCSTPTWIVGLAMLGLGVTASLQLESAGPWIMAVGVMLLSASILYQYVVARRARGLA